MFPPSPVLWTSVVSVLAYSPLALAQSCTTDFDCTSSAAPVCVSGTCGAGPSMCTGDDAAENADDGPAGARALDTNSGAAANLTGAICGVPASEADYYKINVAGGIAVTVTLSWPGSDALELATFDSTGAPLGNVQQPSPETVLLSGLPEGTYYLRVTNSNTSSAAATVYEIEATQDGDLVKHSGFDACWSQARTLSGFLDLLTNSVEGVPGCILSSPGTSPAICTTVTLPQPTCPGGIAGCPITLRAKGPSTNQALIAEGKNQFGSIASVDSFSLPIILLGSECTVTVANVDPVSMESLSILYGIAFDATADGNNGYYLYRLDGVSGATVTNLSSSQLTVSGPDFACSVFTGTEVAPFVASALASAMPAAVTPAQPAATIGATICPNP